MITSRVNTVLAPLSFPKLMVHKTAGTVVLVSKKEEGKHTIFYLRYQSVGEVEEYDPEAIRAYYTDFLGSVTLRNEVGNA